MWWKTESRARERTGGEKWRNYRNKDETKNFDRDVLIHRLELFISIDLSESLIHPLSWGHQGGVNSTAWTDSKYAKMHPSLTFREWKAAASTLPILLTTIDRRRRWLWLLLAPIATASSDAVLNICVMRKLSFKTGLQDCASQTWQCCACMHLCLMTCSWYPWWQEHRELACLLKMPQHWQEADLQHEASAHITWRLVCSGPNLHLLSHTHTHTHSRTHTHTHTHAQAGMVTMTIQLLGLHHHPHAPQPSPSRCLTLLLFGFSLSVQAASPNSPLKRNCRKWYLFFSLSFSFPPLHQIKLFSLFVFFASTHSSYSFSPQKKNKGAGKKIIER